MLFADLTGFAEPLAKTPAVLRAAIEGRSDDWLDRKHAEDVFSPRETVAHLVLCERDWSWIDRTRQILDPSYKNESEEVSEAQILASRSIPELLGDFEALRAKCLKALEELRLTNDDLAKLNEKGTCSARQLLSTWVAHDLYHLGQIFKSYAAPFQSEIGPYQRYLNLPHFN